jgi:hypothetical protein
VGNRFSGRVCFIDPLVLFFNCSNFFNVGGKRA